MILKQCPGSQELFENDDQEKEGRPQIRVDFGQKKIEKRKKLRGNSFLSNCYSHTVLTWTIGNILDNLPVSSIE